jgi:hypothetical protein
MKEIGSKSINQGEKVDAVGKNSVKHRDFRKKTWGWRQKIWQ